MVFSLTFDGSSLRARASDRDRLHRVHQLGAPAVVERERQRHPAVPARELLGVLDVAQHPSRHPTAPSADEANAHSSLVQVVPATEQQRLVEAHQEPHLVDRAAPVLGRKGIHREPRKADLEPTLDGVEQRLFACGMPFGAGQVALPRPPTVSVHHDRHMAREMCQVDAVVHGAHAIGLVSRAAISAVLSSPVRWTAVVNPAAGRGRMRSILPTRPFRTRGALGARDRFGHARRRIADCARGHRSW